MQSCIHYTLRGINYTFEGWIAHYTSRVVDYTFRYTQTTHFIFIEFGIFVSKLKKRKEWLQISNIKIRFFHFFFLMKWLFPIWMTLLDYYSLYIFSCDQAAIWLVQSVCPSVCLSVCPSVRPSVTPFSPCSHHRIIMKFSGVITNDKSDVHAKGQGQRSKVKVTEVNTQLNRFRTVTPVWIHIW